MYEKLPDVLEDKFWDTIDVVVPYTDEAEQFRKKPFHGSAANIQYVDTVVSVNVSHVTFIGQHGQTAVILSNSVPIYLSMFVSDFYSDPVGEWSIAISLSVCLCVCLSVCEHISGTAGSIFTKFCVQIPLWP